MGTDRLERVATAAAIAVYLALAIVGLLFLVVRPSSPAPESDCTFVRTAAISGSFGLCRSSPARPARQREIDPHGVATAALDATR